MQCTTIKNGVECNFMSARGCSYTSGACNAVVEQCTGCARIVEFPSGKFCATYADPGAKWAFGTCNFATHIEMAKPQEHKPVNPLKAS
jgi:hypothetical protein